MVCKAIIDSDVAVLQSLESIMDQKLSLRFFFGPCVQSILFGLLEMRCVSKTITSRYNCFKLAHKVLSSG